MNASDPLEKRIVDELQKTGYPTEIVSASIMQQRMWGVLHNPSYLDDMEGSSREFDIRAYHKWSFTTSGSDFVIGAYLIAECKKSEKPWVFFVTPEEHTIARYGELIKGRMADKQIFATSDNPNSYISDESLRTFHHYFQKPHLARTFYEPFKGLEKSDTSQMIFSAVMSCIKATLFHHQDPPSQRWFRIYYPVIIFSGNLFEAQVDSNQNIALTPSGHVQLSFSYMLPKRRPYASVWEGQQRFIIDVVHEEFLEQFLEMIETEHAILTEKLKTAFGS